MIGTSSNSQSDIKDAVVVSDAQSKLTYRIPYNSFTRLTDDEGLKSAELFRVLLSQSRARLAQSLSRKIVPTLRNGAQWSFAQGLLPTVSIDEVVTHMPDKKTLAELTGVGSLLAKFFAELGQAWCKRDNCEVSLSTPVHVAARVCAEADASETLLIGAHFFNSKKAGALSKLVQSFITAGHKRFLVGHQLQRISSDGSKAEIRSLLSKVRKAGSVTVLVQTISRESLNEAALVEATTHALELGSEVALIQSGRDEGAQCWFSARDYYCPKCHRALSGADIEFRIDDETVSNCLSGSIEGAQKLVSKHGAPHFLKLKKTLETHSRYDLGYVSLVRQFGELSNGEKLKAVLSHFVNADLRETLFMLARPSAELHPRDLIVVHEACRDLADSGNAVLVSEGSQTALELDIKKEVRPKEKLSIESPFVNSGKSVTVPLAGITALVGASGSGKTQLMRAMVAAKGAKPKRVIFLETVTEKKSRTIFLASAAGLFSDIGEVFVRLPLARREGFSAEHFSLDSDAGRCEVCRGTGRANDALDEDNFCDACVGLRFKPNVRAVTLNEQSIADVLTMSVGKARGFFAGYPKVFARLSLLDELGLSQCRLDERLMDLPISVRQRVNLARYLGEPRKKGAVILLEHPLADLCGEDISRCLQVIRKTVEAGNAVILSTNSSEVAACCDFAIELSRD